MFQPYASSTFMDKAGLIPLVGTVAGTARILYGTSKFALNGVPALVNRIAKGNFGNRGEAAVDGFKAVGRGLIELVPFATFRQELKLYRIHDDIYAIKSINTNHILGDKNSFHNTVYQGKIRNGKPIGRGVYTFHNGTVFRGEMEFDPMNGTLKPKLNTRAKLIMIHGDAYEGIWTSSNSFQGTVFYLNGCVYNGQMQIKDQGSTNFIGHYYRHGDGILTRGDLSVVHGFWVKDQLLYDYTQVSP